MFANKSEDSAKFSGSGVRVFTDCCLPNYRTGAAVGFKIILKIR